MLADKIDAVFSPAIRYSYCRTDFTDFMEHYRCALVFAVPYGKQLTLDDYSEALFEEGILEARTVVDTIIRIKIAVRRNVGLVWTVVRIMSCMAFRGNRTVSGKISFIISCVTKSEAGLSKSTAGKTLVDDVSFPVPLGLHTKRLCCVEKKSRKDDFRTAKQ